MIVNDRLREAVIKAQCHAFDCGDEKDWREIDHTTSKQLWDDVDKISKEVGENY